MKPVTADHAQDIIDDRPDRDLPHRPAVVPRPQVFDVAFQRGAVDMMTGHAQFIQGIDLAIGVLARVGEQRPGQLLLNA